MLVVKSLALPVALVALTSYQLREMLRGVFTYFFDAPLAEQASLLTLIFAIVLGVLSLSLALLHEDNEENNGYFASTTLSQPDYPLQALQKAANDEACFQLMYPVVSDQLLDHLFPNDNPLDQAAPKRCRTLLEEHVASNDKLHGGSTVVSVVRALGRTLPHDMARAAVAGWVVECLKSPVLTKDACLSQSLACSILKQHFGHDRVIYQALLDLVLEAIQQTQMGHLLESTASQPTGSSNKMDWTGFTMERYTHMVQHKNSSYLPVAMALVLCGIRNPLAYKHARRICDMLGEYVQIQTDYTNCFGSSQNGGGGTDIQDQKCTWLVVQALPRVNDIQRRVLEQNYGQWNDGKVAKVKALYRELNLPQIFQDYQESSYAAIQTQIVQAESSILPRQVLDGLVQKIYQRTK